MTRSAVANLTSATATLYYGIGSTDGVSDPANLRVVKTNGAGTVWFDVGGTGTAAVTGTITSDPFNTFSLIALGNANGGTNTLPIELRSFVAEAHGSRVHLQWITDSEVNNDYFDIERSKDGRSFSPFARIHGQGTKASSTTYGYLDEKPFGGRSYYRLKQTDFDGTVAYSHVVSVELSTPDHPSVSIHPNPVSRHQFTVATHGLDSDQVIAIRVTDLLGRTVYLKEHTTGKSLSQEFEIQRNGLPSGVYLVTIWHPNGQLATRLVVR